METADTAISALPHPEPFRVQSRHYGLTGKMSGAICPALKLLLYALWRGAGRLTQKREEM